MLSNLWPHTEYAEDQPFPKLILTTHVLHRGFQTGAALGSTTGLIRAALLAYKPTAPSKLYTKFIVPQGSTPATLLMRSTGMGAAIGLGSMAIILPLYMGKRKPVEWQDRSWRLLEHRGQLEVDDWSVVGAVLGLTGTVVIARRNSGLFLVKDHHTLSTGLLVRALGWRNVVAGAGMGSLSGVLGYMGWRYGVMGGER
ncbi:hypothetical protein BDV29DRAFT_202241 [Aspergillus leporis]|uniref:Uncharacterized protein n=1 Tax=Aspergillus leporis TaxID=41062 RepID=A0A5N5WZF9_9EURO|nr:hypothetical protein BDV29DRAFT_202241 [Aspergillus leporis]